MAERDVILKRFAGESTWDILYPKTKVNNVDGLYNRLKDSPYYVVGTGTTSGTWLGTIEGLTSYYDGLMINYKIPVAGASTTTLNINGLGAKTVRRTASAAVTTHLPVNSIMPLVYTTINGVGYFLWADYDSTRSEISEANIINKTSATISAISGRRLEYFLTNTTNARAVGWDNKANASHPHTIAQITNLQTELNSKEQVFTKNAAFNKSFGTTAGTVTQGNDSRLSNARASNDVLAWAKIGNSDLLPTNKLPIIPTSKLPALAITDTFEVATQSAMTTLTAQKGDIAIRSDINKTFILAAEPASTLGNWKELKTPTDLVLSVAGLKGAITSSSLKTSLSLNNVENKSSATIRSEIVIGNLPTGTSGSTIALGNHTHTPSSIGAEPAITKGTASQYFDGTMSLKTFPTSMTPTSHKHNASDIDAGTLGVARGGTGLSSVAADRYLRGNTAGALIARTYEQVKSDLGLHNVNNTSDANKPISTAVATALSGKSSTSHTHNASDITTGTLPNSRIGDNSIGPNKLSRSDTAGVVMKGLGPQANPEWGTLSVSDLPTLTASYVGARPDDWTPTWAQVTSKPSHITGSDIALATNNTAGQTEGRITPWDLKQGIINVAEGQGYINRTIATQAQAEEGTSNTTAMTPLRVKQAIDAKTSTVSTISANITINNTYLNSFVRSNSSLTRTISVPADSTYNAPIGSEVHIFREGTGEVSISPLTGVTLLSEGNKRRINARYQMATLKKIAANRWALIGALKT